MPQPAKLMVVTGKVGPHLVQALRISLEWGGAHRGHATPWYSAGARHPLLHPLHPPAPGTGWSLSGPASAAVGKSIAGQVLSQPQTCGLLLARYLLQSRVCSAQLRHTAHTLCCAHAPAQSCPAPARLQGQQQIVKLPASTIPDTTVHIAQGASNQSNFDNASRKGLHLQVCRHARPLWAAPVEASTCRCHHNSEHRTTLAVRSTAASSMLQHHSSVHAAA